MGVLDIVFNKHDKDKVALFLILPNLQVGTVVVGAPYLLGTICSVSPSFPNLANFT